MIDSQTLNIMMLEPSTKWMAIIFIFFLLLSAITFLMAKTLPLLQSIKQAWNKPTKDIKKYFELRGQIRQACRDIKHHLRADRVSIYEYKNGEVSVGNVPFMKLVITEESHTPYTHSVIADRDTVQSAVFGDLNDEMIMGKTHLIWNIDHIEEIINKDHNLRSLKQYLSKHGTKSVFMFPMFKPDGTPLGFGMVEFVQHPALCEDELISQARTKFGAIGGILTVLANLEGKK